MGCGSRDQGTPDLGYWPAGRLSDTMRSWLACLVPRPQPEIFRAWSLGASSVWQRQ